MIKSSIDKPTAKIFVQGMMKTASELLAIERPSIIDYQNLSKHKAAINEYYQTVLGPCLLHLGWCNRQMSCIYLAPKKPTPESDRPYHGILYIVQYNSRSKVTNLKLVAEITTHVMERMLQRTGNTNLLGVLQEEFNWDFIDAFALAFKNSKQIIGRSEAKVKTANGLACIVFDTPAPPVMTTWYP